MPVNTAALKTFAPAMRRQLLEAVGRKLDLLLTSQTPDTLSTYAEQIAELREQEEENREQLLERVAYTWFNRLCALRYLDARGWHPFGCKVLMPAAEGETQPELLKLMRAGNLPADLQSHTDQGRLHGLLDGQIQTAIAGADPQGEVYRQLVLAVCRCYHELLPNLFEGLDDASELLLPDDLLSDGSIVGAFRKEINDNDCKDVESLGWLYQFYIAEKKDEVMARKKAVPTEDIPAVTQLFTPHWIVRYLVENSLGRLWLLNRPGSKLRDQMPYYIEGDVETDFLVINKPEEIKLLDPACGSGHMLTYAFDLLVLIYEEEGYSPNEIPGLILKHNLHGLEICPRAAQLAELALVFKAREQSRRFFQPEQLVRPQIIELQDVQFNDGQLNDYIEALDLGELFDPNLFKLLHLFEEAKTFGSLIQPCLDERAIAKVRRTIEAKDLGGQLFLRETHLKVLRVLEQAEALAQRYHVVVANPPYLGGKLMVSRVKDFAKRAYPESKADFFAMFMDRGIEITADHGWMAMVTMESWMFLSSFEDLRDRLISSHGLIGMVHMPYLGKGGTPMGINFGTSASIWRRNQTLGVAAQFQCIRHYECDVDMVPITFPTINERYGNASSKDFKVIPGSPIAYWVSQELREAFRSSPGLGDFCDARIGMATGNNADNVRLWTEVNLSAIGLSLPSRDAAKSTGKRWFPYAKGGEFRKWEGNRDFVVNWENDGIKLRTTVVPGGERIWAHNFNLERIYKPGICWTVVTSGAQSFRYYSEGYLFDAASGILQSHHMDEDLAMKALGLLNSKVAKESLSLINPTLNLHPGYLERLPFSPSFLDGNRHLVDSAIRIARADWDNFESSWGFSNLPLLRQGDWEVDSGQLGGSWKGSTLAESWSNYAEHCSAVIISIQEIETQNNRIWIDAYGLQDELTPEVLEGEITLARAEKCKDVAAFLSYATGCMMGRYSLDQPGLILADSRDSQAEQLTAYKEKVGKSISEVQFKLDPDGIIPVLDGEWFEDDIVARTREFLEVTFPESTVTENLRFIEDSLGKDIRKYFCSEFYKDHLQTYKKRPIYWLVQSPKKGFACLIYLHRYTKDTLNQVLNNYFRPYLQKLEARLAQLGLDQLNDDLSTRERTAARKEAEKITKVLKECQAWEQDALLPLAQQRIELDLDDGVKVNYLKLQDVLAPIPGLAAKEE
jgi:hypothetical protein